MTIGLFTNDVSSEGVGRVSGRLRKVDIKGRGGGGPYNVDINHDTLKGWGKEKPNKEKLLLRSGPPFLGLKF